MVRVIPKRQSDEITTYKNDFATGSVTATTSVQTALTFMPEQREITIYIYNKDTAVTDTIKIYACRPDKSGSADDDWHQFTDTISIGPNTRSAPIRLTGKYHRIKITVTGSANATAVTEVVAEW